MLSKIAIDAESFSMTRFELNFTLCEKEQDFHLVIAYTGQWLGFTQGP